jgi:hypothetical protein
MDNAFYEYDKKNPYDTYLVLTEINNRTHLSNKAFGARLSTVTFYVQKGLQKLFDLDPPSRDAQMKKDLNSVSFYCLGPKGILITKSTQTVITYFEEYYFEKIDKTLDEAFSSLAMYWLTMNTEKLLIDRSELDLDAKGHLDFRIRDELLIFVYIALVLIVEKEGIPNE